jgi:hypothetical protein
MNILNVFIKIMCQFRSNYYPTVCTRTSISDIVISPYTCGPLYLLILKYWTIFPRTLFKYFAKWKIYSRFHPSASVDSLLFAHLQAVGGTFTLLKGYSRDE